jgi:hypothetical protein
MKKIALAVVLVIAVLGLVAAPALAGKTMPPQQLPANVTIMWNGGWWMEWSGGVDEYGAILDWHQAYDPSGDVFQPDPPDPTTYKPVSMSRPIYLFGAMIDVGYGTIKNVGKVWPGTVDISGPGGYSKHLSGAQVNGCWTRPFPWDEFWSTTFWPTQPFNASIGSGVYGTCLYLPLEPWCREGGPGTYHVVLTYVQTRQFNSKSLSYDGQHRPFHWWSTPTGVEQYTFDMDVVN